MKTILYISASVRKFAPNQKQHMSISRHLGEVFLASFEQSDSEFNVIYRDLSQLPPPFLDEDFLAAAFTKDELNEKQKQALAYSDAAIAELYEADIIVISSPMYNYGMPAVLKAWFDQVIRVNKTFSFDLTRGDSPLEPILSGKTLVLLASWGEFGFFEGGRNFALNHFSTHIAVLAPYLGTEKYFEIASEYQEFSDLRHVQSKERALMQASALAKSLASAAT